MNQVINLTITERLHLLNLAPKTWDIALYNLRKKMLEKLSLTENEEKIIQFKRGGDKYIENNEEYIVPSSEVRYLPIPLPKEIKFSDWEFEYFKKEIKRLETEKKLNEVTTQLYFKFVEEEKE